MRLPRPSRPKFSWPAAIAVLALVVATTGTAAAVAGQVVNIADPTAANLAKVDSLGRLSVALGGYAVSAGQLQTVNGSPSQPLNLNTSSINTNSGSGSPGELIAPTQAKISLTALTIALQAFGNTDPWQAILSIATVPNGTPAGSCRSAATAFTSIMVFMVSPGQTVTWASSSPLTLAPPAGQTRCLLVFAYNDTGSSATNTGFAFESATGYVSAGTYTGPHNISTATGPKPALPRKTAGHH